MFWAFQDKDNLYVAMDLLEGGDLRFHINKKRKFTEEITSKRSFFIASVFCCLYGLIPGVCAQ